MVGPVGSDDSTASQLSSVTDPGLETIGLKKERIGQSIITAEISVWSGTDAKSAYAATVIFFLAILAICLYAFLRETGADRFMAGAGALMAAVLPAITQLTLDGFLSQAAILFIFPFLASLFQRRDLSPKSFTLFSGLALAYLIAAYSELAPLGFSTLLLGLLFVRVDKAGTKRIMLFTLIPLIILINPLYLPNWIQFVAYQYHLAANATFLWNNVAPNLLSLPGWAALIFGTSTSYHKYMTYY